MATAFQPAALLIDTSPVDSNVEGYVFRRSSSGDGDQSGSPASNFGSTSYNMDELIVFVNGLQLENKQLREKLAWANDTMKSKMEGVKLLVERQTMDKENYEKSKEEMQKLLDQKLILEQRLVELENQLQSVNNGVVNTLKENNEELNRDKAVLLHTIDSLKDEMVILQKHLEQPSPSQESVNTGLMEKFDSSLLVEKFTSSVKELEDMKFQNEKLNSSVDIFKNTIEQLQKECEQVTQLKGQLAEENIKLKNEYDKLDHILKNTTKELNKIQENKIKISEEKNHLLALNNSLQLKVSEFTQANDSGSSIDSGLKNYTELSSVQQNEVMKEQQCQLGATASQPLVAESEGRPRSSSNETGKKTEKAIHDLLLQLQHERENVLKLRNHIKREEERSSELEKELVKCKEIFDRSSSDLNQQVYQLNREHEERINSLMKQIDQISVSQTNEKSYYPSSGEDIQILKQQVLTLVSELKDSEQAVSRATLAVEEYRERCIGLESKIVMLHDELQEQQKRDDLLINSLRYELQNKDAALAAERERATLDRIDINDVHGRYEQLFEDYDNLLREYNNLKKTYDNVLNRPPPVNPAIIQDQQEKIDNLTAKLMTAEEALGMKEEEVRDLKEKNRQMQDKVETVEILKAQAEVFKSDFDAERKSREKAHQEKQELIETVSKMQEQMQEQQMGVQIAEMQRRHIQVAHHQPHDPGAYYRNNIYGGDAGIVGGAGGFYAAGAGGGNFDYAHDGPEQQPKRLIPRIGSQNSEEQSSPPERPVSPVQDNPCPKCHLNFPDIDTLQIHLMDCVK